MKFFKAKYILLSTVILFFLSILVSLIETPKTEYSFGYILGLSVYLFLTWGIFLSIIIFLITLVIGIIRKIKKESPKKMFITSAISIGTSVVLFIVLGIVAVITENTSESINTTKQKSTASVSPKNLITEKTIDAGDFRMYDDPKNIGSRFVFYDDATFTDSFAGLEVTLNPIGITNKHKDSNGQPVSAVIGAFSVKNNSNSTFIFDSKNITVATNQLHSIPNAHGGEIKQSVIRPNDSYSKQVAVFMTDSSNDLESADWITFDFNINKQDKDGQTSEIKKYKVKFNITKHYKEDTTQSESSKTIDTEEPTVQKSKEINSSTNSPKDDNNKQFKKYSLESDITSLIEDKITNAEIDKIEVNEHLGTQEDGDYIALIHLKFKPKNSNETTLKLIDLYNNEIGAQLAKQKEIQEVTIFWEAPYIKEDMNIVKANLQRNGDNMIFNNTWVAPLMK
ncbi:TPA: hypothetical protein ACGXNJ_001557 [Bacillus cereus]